MIVVVVPLDSIETTLLIVVLHADNLERMKQGDPFTLEGRMQGGMLPDFRYPSVSVMIAYEEDVERIQELASRKDKRALFEHLRRGYKFVEGVDGKSQKITPGTESLN